MELEKKILSDITVHMKYARYLESESRRENWDELVSRNMNMHIKKFPSLKPEIENAYKFVHDKKVLPSMRSMQFGGKPIEVSPNRIFNCAFCPADNYHVFSEIMFLLLGGTGVGFSVQKHHINKLPEIRRPSRRSRRFLIGDSIEGWADSVKALIASYFKGTSRLRFDFSDIRPKGARLVTSGGKAPGPQPLKECLVKIEGILDAKDDGEQLTPIEVHDIICYIADAVLAGGIRRAALISLFSADDEEMLAAKAGNWWELNPQRGRANNSVVLMRHLVTEDFFKDLWFRVKASGAGEPGFYFSNDKDWGTNPCCEIALRPYQFCNLSEVVVRESDDLVSLRSKVRIATILGTFQSTLTDLKYLRKIWKTNTEEERLLGVSLTGIMDNYVLARQTDSKVWLQEMKQVAVDTNKEYAQKIGIPRSTAITCVKPSGTVSQLTDSASGIHARHNPFYVRTVRGDNKDPLTQFMKEENIPFEPDITKPDSVTVFSFPMKSPSGAITRTEMSAIEQLELWKVYALYWCEHKPSVTISVKESEWMEVGAWLYENFDIASGVSFLPFSDHTYQQAPYQDIDADEYIEWNGRVPSSLDWTKFSMYEKEDNTSGSRELACTADACEVVDLSSS